MLLPACCRRPARRGRGPAAARYGKLVLDTPGLRPDGAGPAGRGSRDWLEQSRANLVHAEPGREDGDYAWACSAAHQAADGAVKPLHLRCGQVAWERSVTQLLESLLGAVRPGQEFIAEVGVLDRS